MRFTDMEENVTMQFLTFLKQKKNTQTQLPGMH